MEEILRRDIDRFVEENTEAIKRDIARLVAINSVEGEASEDAPFGPGPREALKLGLQIARELGLGAVDCEGRIGYAALGEGEKYLATITHLDVVPVADGWTGDPFVMREKDGWLLGRGVLDDKGPSVLCLYALKYLKEKEIPLRYPIRALLGANEETGMADVTYYLENYPVPVFCFSPDADFPLVNGEKGIFHGTLRSRVALDKIVDIHGGVAANAIPQKAEALVKAAQLRSAGRVTAEPAGEGLWKLTAEGVAGHASMPAGTVNAIGVLVDYLLDNKVCSGDEEKLLELLAALHRHTDGSGLGVQADDGLFQPLTIVGGLRPDRRGGRCPLPVAGQPLSHQHQRGKDRRRDSGESRGSGRGAASAGRGALLHASGQPRHPGLHRGLQRRHRRERRALYHRRRYLRPGFPQCGLLRAGAL